MAGMREPLGQYQTSGEIKLGPFMSDVDGITPLTNLTITQGDVKLSKNNSTFAPKSDASVAAHDERGWYDITLNSMDVNTVGFLDVLVDLDGAFPVKRKYAIGSPP